MKNWEESWKRKELRKNPEHQKKIEEERALNKKKAHNQNVIIKFSKHLIRLPHFVNSFEVHMKNPLKREDVMKRMSQAFPELTLKEEENV